MIKACSKYEFSGLPDGEVDKRMSASGKSVAGYGPGVTWSIGWQAKNPKVGDWFEYDTSDNPRLLVESQTIEHRSVFVCRRTEHLPQ